MIDLRAMVCAALTLMGLHAPPVAVAQGGAIERRITVAGEVRRPDYAIEVIGTRFPNESGAVA